MIENAWHRLGDVTADDLADALHETHWALQLVAAAGQNFVSARDDDSHRTATWDARRGALVGEPFDGAYPFRVGLRLDDLSLHMFDRTDESLAVLPLAGQTLEDAYAWLAAGVGSYSGSLPVLDRPEYDMPDHPVGAGRPFANDRDAARRTIAALYETSAQALAELVDQKEGAAEVRCWPHHFDIATLVPVGQTDDGAAQTIGVGMSPFGGGYESWYWYVSPYPFPAAEDLPELDGPGNWHTDGWTGAALTFEEVVRADAAFRPPLVRGFIERAWAGSLTALGR